MRKFLVTCGFYLATALTVLAEHLPVIHVVADPDPTDRLFRQARNAAVLKRDDLLVKTESTYGDVAGQMPNVVYHDMGARSFNSVSGARGIMNSFFYSDPALVFYVDGVPYLRPSTFSMPQSNIDYVTVERGARSGTTGLNAAAGSVEIFSRRAENTWRAESVTVFGSHDLFQETVSASGALIDDQLYLTITGFHSRRDGYQYDTVSGRHVDGQFGYGGSVKLTWQPDIFWSFDLKYEQGKFEDGGQRFAPLVTNDPTTLSLTAPGEMGSENRSISFTSRYADGEHFISSATVFHAWNQDPFTADLDLTPAAVFFLKDGNIARRNWIQEVRVGSDNREFHEEFMWQGGAFFSHDTAEFNIERRFGPIPLTDRHDYGTGETAGALFGELSVPLTSTLALVPAVRFDIREKRGYQRSSNILTGVPTNENASKVEWFASPQLGLEYRPTAMLLTYARAGLSHRAGGVATFHGSSNLQEYDQEETVFGEVGVKSRWFNDRLQVNAGGFYYRIRDYQYERFGSAANYTVSNAPLAHSWGGEVDVSYEPVDGLVFGASFGTTQARFAKLTDPVTGADLEGKRVPFLPDFEAITYLAYRHRTGWNARVETEINGTIYGESKNLPLGRQVPIAQLHARFGYEGEYFGLHLFGRNLLDASYYDLKMPEFGVGIAGTPQVVGCELTLKY